MEIRNLILEVTRRCNMSCEHCLRGDAENLDLKKEYVDTLLDQLDGGWISSVTFTGGEPSLNVPIIEYFLNEIIRRNIGLGFFYIATNGLKISVEFIIVCLRLYSYSDEKDMCTIDVSNDYYHQCENDYNTDLLDGLSFFKRKFSIEGYDYDGGRRVLREGRGEDFGGNNITVQTVETIEDLEETEIYLNCEGKIINGCDWSYKNQKKHILCEVENLETYYKTLEEV